MEDPRACQAVADQEGPYTRAIALGMAISIRITWDALKNKNTDYLLHTC